MKFKTFIFLLLCITFSLQAQKTEELTYKKGDILMQLSERVEASVIAKRYVEQGLRLEKRISKHMNVYLYRFDADACSHDNFLELLERDDEVIIAQNNHIIRKRQTFPTESVPWPMHNTTTDADIDAPEAWDYAIGDSTALGDPIVIAVFDGPFDLGDLDRNYWKNDNEIPDNGVDDDGNGYVDDYNGWNSVLDTDSVSLGIGHGHAVAGRASRINNNGGGTAGLLWNVRVMPIDVFNGTLSLESYVMEAFDYVINERMIYDATNGADGSFIVSTNHSYGGVGSPSTAPLWCGAYATAGSVGILSAGATLNSYTYVDINNGTPDLPTSCPEDHLISVTQTDNVDEQKTSGYGAIDIDLGSPSEGSTSMATPLVTGSVALLLSAACPSFVTDYKNKPDSMALVIKDYIMRGVDPVADLQGTTVSGGRLNLFNSVALLLSENCGQSFPPIVSFSSSELQVCVGDTVTFFDETALQPISWNWNFQGGMPATSTIQNPKIVYNAAGTYNVTLTATNNDGNATQTVNALIEVLDPMGINLPYSQDFEINNDWTIVDLQNDNFTWNIVANDACHGSVIAMDNFTTTADNITGTKDQLTASFDLSNYSNCTLTFDVAYAQYNNTFSDNLKIMLDVCNALPDTIYDKSSSVLATAPDITTAFVPTDCSQWRNETIDLSAYDGEIITLTFENNSGWGNWLYLDNIIVSGNTNTSAFTFDGKVLLEGAYNTNGMMRTNLNSVIPLNQPYNIAPYNYIGIETLVNIPNNMVDWILVEARTGTPNLSGIRGTTTEATQAAILLNDGSIVDVNGNLLTFQLIPNIEYYFCIRHRNHLDVLSANPISANGNLQYDFTTNIAQAFGAAQQKISPDNRAFLYAGDYTQDATIQVSDFDAWKIDPAQLNIYSTLDGNLDGVVQVTDYDVWLPNKAKIGTIEISF